MIFAAGSGGGDVVELSHENRKRQIINGIKYLIFISPPFLVRKRIPILTYQLQAYESQPPIFR